LVGWARFSSPFSLPRSLRRPALEVIDPHVVHVGELGGDGPGALGIAVGEGALGDEVEEEAPASAGASLGRVS
jgi:hypothetical protein